ncbi:MAG TPA: hypothetical protein VI216_06445, partial [Candidatus Acidoferrales bacterium]
NPANHDADNTQNTSQLNSVQGSARATQQENGASSYSPNKVFWWEDEAKATWALVVVGALGTVAAIWTLVTIRKQTIALMDADHALVVIMWTDYAHVDPSKPNTLSHCFQWDVRNAGKSPAFIQTINSRLLVVNRLEDLPRTPGYRSAPREMSHKMEPLVPGKEFGRFYASVESPIPYASLEADLKQQKCFLYAYGFVRYLDIHRRKHETRFGLVYDPVGDRDPWKLAGPRQYNRYT